MLGQPNAGKSSLFNVLSDRNTSTSNFAGTSVELSQAVIRLWGEEYLLLDLPGTYSLSPGDDAERLTLKYLLEGEYDLILNVIDASLINRSLELTLELSDLRKPMVIALNMADEAERKGVEIDVNKLENELGVPVELVSALYGKGIRQLFDKCVDSLNGRGKTPTITQFNPPLERDIHKLEKKIIEINGEKFSRFYAIKGFENPQLLPEPLKKLALNCAHEAKSCDLCAGSEASKAIDNYRHSQTMALAEKVSTLKRRHEKHFREKLDRALLHPIFGFAFLIIFFTFYFSSIFVIGNFLNELISYPLGLIPESYAFLKASNPFLFASIDGIYQGFVGAIGIVVPYFLPLLFLTAIFEDTGYLARIAFLMDELMHKIGLHGKSVASFILGFGCSVPALYSARILENKRDRIITAALVPFIPCTARTAVIFALSAAFLGPWAALAIYAILLLIVALSGKAISLVVKNPVNLIIEIPDLKRPSVKVALNKTWFRIKDFLIGALPFLIIGSLAMSWLDFLQINTYINIALKPLTTFLLGVPEQLGTTLVFGFFKKELIIVMANQAFGVDNLQLLPMSKIQIFTFIIFVSLYFPCFSTFVALIKEFGVKISVLTATFSIFVATISAVILRYLLIIFHIF